MAIPTNQPIRLSDIDNEYGGVNPISLSEYYRNGLYVPTNRTTAAIPTSGTIGMNLFRGTIKSIVSAVQVPTATIASNAQVSLTITWSSTPERMFPYTVRIYYSDGSNFLYNQVAPVQAAATTTYPNLSGVTGNTASYAVITVTGDTQSFTTATWQVTGAPNITSVLASPQVVVYNDSQISVTVNFAAVPPGLANLYYYRFRNPVNNAIVVDWTAFSNPNPGTNPYTNTLGRQTVTIDTPVVIDTRRSNDASATIVTSNQILFQSQQPLYAITINTTDTIIAYGRAPGFTITDNRGVPFGGFGEGFTYDLYRDNTFVATITGSKSYSTPAVWNYSGPINYETYRTPSLVSGTYQIRNWRYNGWPQAQYYQTSNTWQYEAGVQLAGLAINTTTVDYKGTYTLTWTLSFIPSQNATYNIRYNRYNSAGTVVETWTQPTTANAISGSFTRTNNDESGGGVGGYIEAYAELDWRPATSATKQSVLVNFVGRPPISIVSITCPQADANGYIAQNAPGNANRLITLTLSRPPTEGVKIFFRVYFTPPGGTEQSSPERETYNLVSTTQTTWGEADLKFGSIDYSEVSGPNGTFRWAGYIQSSIYNQTVSSPSYTLQGNRYLTSLNITPADIAYGGTVTVTATWDRAYTSGSTTQIWLGYYPTAGGGATQFYQNLYWPDTQVTSTNTFTQTFANDTNLTMRMNWYQYNQPGGYLYSNAVTFRARLPVAITALSTVPDITRTTYAGTNTGAMLSFNRAITAGENLNVRRILTFTESITGEVSSQSSTFTLPAVAAGAMYNDTAGFPGYRVGYPGGTASIRYEFTNVTPAGPIDSNTFNVQGGPGIVSVVGPTGPVARGQSYNFTVNLDRTPPSGLNRWYIDIYTAAGTYLYNIDPSANPYNLTSQTQTFSAINNRSQITSDTSVQIRVNWYGYYGTTDNTPVQDPATWPRSAAFTLSVSAQAFAITSISTIPALTRVAYNGGVSVSPVLTFDRVVQASEGQQVRRTFTYTENITGVVTVYNATFTINTTGSTYNDINGIDGFRNVYPNGTGVLTYTLLNVAGQPSFNTNSFTITGGPGVTSIVGPAAGTTVAKNALVNFTVNCDRATLSGGNNSWYVTTFNASTNVEVWNPFPSPYYQNLNATTQSFSRPNNSPASLTGTSVYIGLVIEGNSPNSPRQPSSTWPRSDIFILG